MILKKAGLDERTLDIVATDYMAHGISKLTNMDMATAISLTASVVAEEKGYAKSK